MPRCKKEVRAEVTTAVSRQARVEVTSSLARHTWLIAESERFEARRWETRPSMADEGSAAGEWGRLSVEEDMGGIMGAVQRMLQGHSQSHSMTGRRN